MRKLSSASALLAIICVAAWADPGDPPSRVARLSYESGSVSFRPGSVEDWTAAQLNYPLTTSDHLWTDAGAQAEIHIGSTAVRMNAQTALSVLNLDDRTVQLSLTQGAVQIHIRQLESDEAYEIDTPNVAISLVRPGDYRIDADGDRNITLVAARAGEAEVNGGGAAFSVQAGQQARVSGVDTVAQEMNLIPSPDGWDRWCENRDQREDQSVSARYVSRDMTGYQDLDSYGVWRNVPGYGWCWVPTAMASGWAPYRFGHWVWVEPWGWTWVDDAPWGFAPFHYGRWAFAAGGWLWVPGRIAPRPVYAPALVAFVGGGGFHFSVAIGSGVAWFPLGPGEVYRPAYRVSPAYVRQVNITHVTNINVINVTNVRYVNRGVAGAVTAVRQEDFVASRPVGRVAVRVQTAEIERAPIAATAPFAPSRASVLGRSDGIRPAGPPERFVSRQVVARATPPPTPVPFTARQEALRANQGRPLDADTLNHLRSASPERNPQVRSIAARPAAPREENWRQVNSSESSPAVQRPAMRQNDRPARAMENQPAREPQRSTETQPRNDRPTQEMRRESNQQHQAQQQQRDQRQVEKRQERQNRK
ncbi:MAG TPA: DUF6600 domain-containing protein [Bryobacteraceae bacterium]|nr:DUF6600 domain-containing protein [Bryobacteraceae bacterium]